MKFLEAPLKSKIEIADMTVVLNGKSDRIELINGDYYIIKAKQITDSTGRFMFTKFENGKYFVIASYVIYDSLQN